MTSNRNDAVLIGTVTLALAAGALATVMFWSALLGIGWSALALIALVVGVGLGGVIVWTRRGDRETRTAFAPDERLLLAVIVLVAGASAFNAGYLPFSKADALGIYLPAANAMWRTGTLEPLIGADSLYRTYPVLVPSLYTTVFLASGWANEPLAKLMSAVLALGCLPAVFLLGREVGGRRVGLYAAAILAVTPSFARWSSSGYVDLPMAFYYTLAVLFALRHARRGNLVDAALAGTMIGLAAITKNAGLIGGPLLAFWLGAVAFTRWRRGGGLRLTPLIVGLGLSALIAAPWYARNLIGAGFLVPATAWTDQAERSLRTLGIFVTLTDNFALSGWLVMGGIRDALWRVVRRGANGDAFAAMLWFSVPFFAAWWIFVSYDPRFLLLFYPLLCVAGGAFVEALRPDIRRAVVIAVALVGLYCIWIAVEFKDDIARAPLMTYHEKLILIGREPE